MRKTIKKLKPLLLQLLVLLLLSAAVPLVSVLLGLGPLLTAGYWAVVPLAGFLSALKVTRAGISCYLAWILPPVCMSAAPWLLIGYPPPAGAMLLCAFLSIVGAATGDVLNRQGEH